MDKFYYIPLIALIASGILADEPVVNIGDTMVKGAMINIDGSDQPVYAFKGIYYAESPVGERRFAPPQPKRLPPGAYDASKYGPLCPQDVEMLKLAYYMYHLPVEETSEDCLHLDVYTAHLDPRAELAVMVYFHGGAFVNGGNSAYDMSPLAAFQNVVVVVVNYRLGALGFLSTGDKVAAGNYGLMDQSLALKWVHDNIKMFGGSQERVTIFGESAGGMSVSLHILSDLNRKLFQRAIVQSGPATSPMLAVEKPLKWANQIADAVGCLYTDTETMIGCLREKPANDIISLKIPNVPDKPAITFPPVVDGEFLFNDPHILYQAGLFQVHADLLIGFNNHEMGYGILATRGPAMPLEKFGVEEFKQFLKVEVQKYVPGDLSSVIDFILREYGGEGGITDETAMYAFTEVVGDAMFVAPSVDVATHVKESGRNVYMYEFQLRPSFYQGPEWVRSDHGVDEAFTLGIPFLNASQLGLHTFTEDEVKFSMELMTYWANFAKTGDPNNSDGPAPVSNLSYWPPFQSRSKNYMKLGLQSEEATKLKTDKLTFWNKIVNVGRVIKNKKRYGHLYDEL